MRAILRLVVGFLVLAAIAVGAVWVADRPGAITVYWLGQRIDTTVGVVAGGLLLLLILVALLVRWLGALLRSPRFLRRRRLQSRERSGEHALVRGLVAVAAGDPRDAKRQALRAEKSGAHTSLTLLLSAQAAQLNGDAAAAQRAYELMREDPDTRFLALRGLIVLARRRGDTQAALALAEEARKIRPDAPWIANELFGLQAASGHWLEADKSLSTAIRRKLIPPGEGQHHRAVVALSRAQQEEAAGNPREALIFAETAHRQSPGLVPAALVTARLLAANGKVRRAEKLIEESWRDEPHPDLARAYDELRPDTDNMTRIERLTRLADLRPTHVESRLLRAEQGLARHRWLDARDELEAAMRDAPDDRRIFEKLASLERAEKGDEKAATRWEEEAAMTPLPARWVCRACGHGSRDWSAHCPSCKAFDSLSWQRPAPPGEILPPPQGPADGVLDALPEKPPAP